MFVSTFGNKHIVCHSVGIYAKFLKIYLKKFDLRFLWNDKPCGKSLRKTVLYKRIKINDF
ncbi:hypothetical protein GCM10022217_13310 [Chryseobacterium ginsenosidimutans]